MTLTSQYIKFITDTQRRIENEEVRDIRGPCSSQTNPTPNINQPLIRKKHLDIINVWLTQHFFYVILGTNTTMFNSILLLVFQRCVTGRVRFNKPCPNYVLLKILSINNHIICEGQFNYYFLFLHFNFCNKKDEIIAYDD